MHSFSFVVARLTYSGLPELREEPAYGLESTLSTGRTSKLFWRPVRFCNSCGSSAGDQRLFGQFCEACKHCSLTCLNLSEGKPVEEQTLVFLLFATLGVETLRQLGNESVYFSS